MGLADNDAWVDSALAEHVVITDDVLGHMDLDQGFDEVLARVFAAEPRGSVVPLRKRRVSRKVASLSIAFVVVASAGAAAAVKSGALTGLFPPPGATENGNTEIVNFAAANFAEVAHQLADQDEKAGLTFAPGYSANKNIDAAIEGYQRTAAQLGSGETAEQQIKGEFAFDAACTWQRSWLAAYANHDGAEMSGDVRGMVAITHVVVSSPGRDGTTITEAVLSGINETRTQREFIRYMEHGNVAQLTVDTVNGCPTPIK